MRFHFIKYLFNTLSNCVLLALNLREVTFFIILRNSCKFVIEIKHSELFIPLIISPFSDPYFCDRLLSFFIIFFFDGSKDISMKVGEVIYICDDSFTFTKDLNKVSSIFYPNLFSSLS